MRFLVSVLRRALVVAASAGIADEVATGAACTSFGTRLSVASPIYCSGGKIE